MIMKKMKGIGYWATTIIVALELLAGGVTDLVHGPTLLFVGEPVVEVLAHLGYPVYLLTILGVWRQLGAIASHEMCNELSSSERGGTRGAVVLASSKSRGKG